MRYDFLALSLLVLGFGAFLFWYGLPQDGTVKPFVITQYYTFAIIMTLVASFALMLNGANS